MFGSNFKYSLKILFKNKILIFWTFIFPIILGLFFNLAFSDIENNDKFDTIDIAIVDNDSFKNDVFLKNAFKSLSENDDTKIFNITYTDLDTSKKMLRNKKITGYILFNNDKRKIVVRESGVSETILKYVVDEIKIKESLINDLVEEKVNRELISGNININMNEIYEGVLKIVNDEDNRINDVTKDKLSYTMIEYYTLIAMAALYGGMISLFITNYRLPNMSSLGKRFSLMPISKFKMLFSSLLASYVVQLMGILLLFLFTIFVLKVDYGNKIFLVVILALIGSFAGLTLGVFIASMFKVNENAKTGILISITMLFSFLAGMMGITTKYVVDVNFPILNIINPANMITDGLYSLYYYNTLDRYVFNVLSLMIFSSLLLFISSLELRRQKYDSI